MSNKNKSNEWVVYPDIPDHIIIDEYKKQLNMQEKDNIVIDTLENFDSINLPIVKNVDESLIKDSITEDIENEITEEENISSNMSDEPDENKELSEEEKREKYIQALKESKKTYHPKKDFGTAYKTKRQRKNREAKKSRKANR